MLTPLLRLSFRLHDWASAWLAANFFQVKTGLLVVAHLSLLGFLFPEARKEFGSVAGNLLIAILFLSPVSKIFRIRLLQQLMGLRRELGIWFAYLATVHGIGFLTDPYIGALVRETVRSQGFFSLDPLFLFGISAYLLTLPLLITSNNLANRLLGGRNWKLLHRTVYVMALFAVIHRFVTHGLTPWALLEMLVLTVGYILAKLLAWKNFLPPLVQVNAWVASEYQQFKTLATAQSSVSSSGPSVAGQV